MVKVHVLVSLLSGQPLAANLGRVEGGANRWALILPVSLFDWRRSIRKWFTFTSITILCTSLSCLDEEASGSRVALSSALGSKSSSSVPGHLLLGKWEWVSFVQSCLQISNSCNLTLRLGALTLTLIILCNSDLSDVCNVWFGRALWWALPLFPMMTDSIFDES